MMSTKYKATTTEDYYFIPEDYYYSSVRNYADIDNELAIILLYLF